MHSKAVSTHASAQACVKIPRASIVVCAVSRSEAGQQKALVVLDSNWRETERVPIDIGPRFHTLSSAKPQLPPDLRQGDRCSLSISLTNT